ncbi:hypothetical protein BGP77_06355 [Saccharospirillum sp. MSK14-1]|nr:hypothetical protein BGP77_06355 [Saccharospirillum sp. MSK14-1]
MLLTASLMAACQPSTDSGEQQNKGDNGSVYDQDIGLIGNPFKPNDDEVDEVHEGEAGNDYIQSVEVEVRSPKRLHFQWSAKKQADYYNLIAMREGKEIWSSGQLQYETAYDMHVPLYDPAMTTEPLYMLQPCSAINGCDMVTAAQTGLINRYNMLDGIGYFKSNDPVKDGEFGRVVELSENGDWMAVGGSGSDQRFGLVHLYRRHSNGFWSLNQVLKLPDAEANDEFGASLSFSRDGRVLAVGAPGRNVAYSANYTLDSAGHVFLFQYDGSAWQETDSPLISLYPHRNGHFGASVSLNDNGDRLAIGATGEHETGEVYVFEKPAAGWRQARVTHFAFPDGRTNVLGLGQGALFGKSVSISGDGSRLAVGAPEEVAPVSLGKVFIFFRKNVPTGEADVWRTGSDWRVGLYGLKQLKYGQGESHFGTSVSLSANGRTLAVGASYDSRFSSSGFNNEPERREYVGAAYVWNLPEDCTQVPCENSWLQPLIAWDSAHRHYIKASNIAESTRQYFGHQISLSSDGKRLAVSAINETSRANGIGGSPVGGGIGFEYAGAAYVFQPVDGQWTERSYIKASNSGGGDYFGHSLSLSGDGDTLAVGAPYEDRGEFSGISNGLDSNQNENNKLKNSGAVYLY